MKNIKKLYKKLVKRLKIKFSLRDYLGMKNKNIKNLK